MEQTILTYEIEIKINDEKSNDVNSFLILRCPFKHTASYSILDIMVELTLYNDLTFMITQHDFPDVILNIYIVDNIKSRVGSSIGERIKHIATKHYKCIFIESGESSGISNSYMQCVMYLVNPILYYLNNTNSYNVILNNIRGIDVIENYETHLKTVFGNTAFDFVKVSQLTNLNEFKHEQLLIRLKNDLMIPSWIIQNYKPFNSYGFYFYDDFKIDAVNKSEITAYLINLSNKNSFSKIESLKDSKYVDAMIGNTFIDVKPIGDRFDNIGQEKPSIVIKNSNLQFKFKKSNIEVKVPTSSSLIETEQLEEERTINTIKTQISKILNKPTEETVIYAPDSVNVAIDRFHIVRKQLTTELESINTFYMRDAHIDFLQFGNMYNINPMIPHEHVYTPINIVNCFIRNSGSVPILVHNVRYQMLKFAGETN